MAAAPSFKPGKEIHLHAKAYLHASHLEGLFSLYFLYTGCLNICSHGPKRTDRQINKDTNTHPATKFVKRRNFQFFDIQYQTLLLQLSVHSTR